MCPRVRGQAIYVISAAIVLLVVMIAVRREPTYQGKRVREWVWDYTKSNRDVFQPPTVPMRQIGPRAVPLLVTELKRQNPITHKLRFRVWNTGPAWLRARMRDSYDDVRDAYLLRESAAITLGGLGAEARSAIPDLRGALRDSTPHVQLRAAYAMWQIDHSLATEVVPILMELHTNAYEFKYYTTFYFGSIGPEARAAIPLLQEALNDPNPNVQGNARRALRKVEVADSKQ
jgi:HEAT repeat protein